MVRWVFVLLMLAAACTSPGTADVACGPALISRLSLLEPDSGDPIWRTITPWTPGRVVVDGFDIRGFAPAIDDEPSQRYVVGLDTGAIRSSPGPDAPSSTQLERDAIRVTPRAAPGIRFDGARLISADPMWTSPPLPLTGDWEPDLAELDTGSYDDVLVTDVRSERGVNRLVVVHDHQTGDLLWEATSNRASIVTDELVIVQVGNPANDGTTSTVLEARDRRTGELVWALPGNHHLDRLIGASDDHLWITPRVGRTQTNLIALSDGSVRSIDVYGTVWATLDDGTAYLWTMGADVQRTLLRLHRVDLDRVAVIWSLTLDRELLGAPVATEAGLLVQETTELLACN